MQNCIDTETINGWICWYRADLGYWHATKGKLTASAPTRSQLLWKIGAESAVVR